MLSNSMFSSLSPLLTDIHWLVLHLSMYFCTSAMWTGITSNIRKVWYVSSSHWGIVVITIVPYVHSHDIMRSSCCCADLLSHCHCLYYSSNYRTSLSRIEAKWFTSSCWSLSHTLYLLFSYGLRASYMDNWYLPYFPTQDTRMHIFAGN